MSKISKAFKKVGHELEHAADKAVHEVEKAATSDTAKAIGGVVLDIVENPQVQQAALDVAVAAI